MTKALWQRIMIWCECDDQSAMSLAAQIIRSNPYYWALGEEELRQWARELHTVQGE